MRPSIVTQAQFDELSEMKVRWDKEKKDQEEKNLKSILLDAEETMEAQNNSAYDLHRPKSTTDINQIQVQIKDSNSLNASGKLPGKREREKKFYR